MSRARTSFAVVVAALSLSWLHGCGGEGTRLPPAPVASDDDGGAIPTGNATSSGNGATSTTSTGSGPVTPFRTVIERTPYGNVAASYNLMWDGDFEWRPPFASQYGWIQAESPSFGGQGNTKQVIGPSCRSGIKCTLMESDDVLLGLAVSSQNNPLRVTFYAAPDGGDCLGLSVTLINQELFTAADLITPVADTADEEGWCFFDNEVPAKQHAQFLYIHNATTNDTIIDDVVIGIGSQQAQASQLVADPVITDHVRQVGRAYLKPRILPKTKGQLAYEAHMQKGWRLRR